MLRILQLSEAQSFITRKTVRLAQAEQTVAPILEAVRARGDEAVLEYARKFDGFEGASLRVSTAGSPVSPEFQTAIETAAKNIREYAELQLPRETWVEFEDGRRLGYVVRPLESMGAYIPAGRYPLPSTPSSRQVPSVPGSRRIPFSARDS
jgi:histidinol dehydrogenase